VWVCLAERDAQRAPLTATPSEATNLKITPGPENGKRGGGSLEQKLDISSSFAHGGHLLKSKPFVKLYQWWCATQVYPVEALEL